MTTELTAKITDLANTVASFKRAQEELLADLGQDIPAKGWIKRANDAILQLEAQFNAIEASIDQKVAKARRTAWDAHGNYRGLFASEDQARAFGLMVLAVCGQHAKAATMLKGDYPDLHARAMASNPDAVGGALIPPEFAARIVRLVEEYGVFERHAMRMPMSTDSVTFIKQTGEVSVYLVGENSAGGTSEPGFSNIALAAKEWGTLTYYPRTLDEDAAASLGELLARSIAHAFALRLDQVGFNGDGTSSSFGILGLRPKLAAINGVDDGGGLVLGSGNEYGELQLADHVKVIGTLPQYAAAQARWYVSRAYFFNVMVKLMLSAGGVTAGEVQGRRALLFNGDPVEITQVMPSVQANSQICALYGDLSAAATIGDRRQMRIEQSREYKFAERQVTVLGTRRIAVNCHDLGTATEAGPVVGLITAAS
jgi:HK97 family phage major capsid protein